MRVNEIFASCQGEGVNAGLPTIFVRLAGCNLYPDRTCSYCDTKYAQSDKGREMSIKTIISKVREYKSTNVCITGGEPLHQGKELFDLVDLLRFHEYYIEIFTNATLSMPAWNIYVDSWIADIKCPSSGVKSRFNDWMSHLGVCDQLKFTVADEDDLNFVSVALQDYSGHAQVVVSPVIPNCPNAQFGEVLMANRVWLQTVWNFCITNNCRYSLQLHKIVFGNKKGV